MNNTIITTAMITAITLTTVMTAYADHVDNHIWIETAEGSFATVTDTMINKIEEVSNDWGITYSKTGGLSGIEIYGYYCDVNVEYETDYTRPGEPTEIETNDRRLRGVNTAPETTIINEIGMINQRKGDCGDKQAEENYVNTTFDKQTSNFVYPITILYTPHKEYHECVCGYWYTNTVQDEYKYTIIDLPRDRELPPNYKNMVATGVQAGFDQWADINDITFTYTDNRLEADIIIQQQIGDGRQMGNAKIGCLFDQEQCTIQLFTDVNVGYQQTLLSTPAIEWTIAHEFGHLIGLPHHIDPDHIMNTIHADNVRDYWEARNINVPRMTEPINEQILLENDNDYRDYATYIPTNTDELMKHPTVIEFIELMQAITKNSGTTVWTDIIDILTDAIITQ